MIASEPYRVAAERPSTGNLPVISPNVQTEEFDSGADSETQPPPASVVLVRYGQVPQVARFGVSSELHANIADQLARNCRLVMNTDRGVEIGTVLEVLKHITGDDDSKPTTGDVLRIAQEQDRQAAADMAERSVTEFNVWQDRISNWKLQLQLVDLEWTLDGQHIILYVLNGQDAEVTRLALLAAAAGLGIVHVQPVVSDGLAPKPSGGGGCGSGGCGSGGCGS